VAAVLVVTAWPDMGSLSLRFAVASAILFEFVVAWRHTSREVRYGSHA
jgi:hypothetical protein